MLVTCTGPRGCDDNLSPACDLTPMPGGSCRAKEEGNAYCYTANLVSICKSGTWVLDRCLHGCAEDGGFTSCY